MVHLDFLPDPPLPPPHLYQEEHVELLSGAIVDHELNVKTLQDQLETVEGEKLEVEAATERVDLVS